MKAILLLRVSSLHQDYEQQKEELISYCKSLGYDNFVVIEDKESAIKLSEEERNGLNKLKEIAEDGDVTFVYELSRLARSEKVLYSMKDWFIGHKVNLYIYDKRYKLLNDDGTVNSETELLFSLYAYFASQEMKTKRIRTERGKAFARQQGKFAAGHLLYGYTTDNDNYIIIDKDKMENVIYIVNKYITTDITIGALGTEMYDRGIFNDNKRKSCQCKVGKILTNKNYYGINDSPLQYPQALPTEWLDKVNIKLSKALKIPRMSKHICFGKSLLRLKDGLSFKMDVGRVSYFVREPKYLTFQMNFIDSVIWELTKNWFYPYIYAHLKNNKHQEIKEQININEQKLTTINKKYLELEEKEKRLNDLYLDLKYTKEQYTTKYKEIMDEKTVLKRSKTLLDENSISLHKSMENLSKGLKLIDFNEIYDGLTDERMKNIIDETLNLITVEHIRYDIYRLHFYSKSGFNEPFLIDKKRYKLYFKNDYNRWEEYDDLPFLKRFSYKRKG